MNVAGVLTQAGARLLLDDKCNDARRKLGGVPFPAWIVLIFFAGLVIGSVITLLYQQWERSLLPIHQLKKEKASKHGSSSSRENQSHDNHDNRERGGDTVGFPLYDQPMGTLHAHDGLNGYGLNNNLNGHGLNNNLNLNYKEGNYKEGNYKEGNGNSKRNTLNFSWMPMMPSLKRGSDKGKHSPVKENYPTNNYLSNVYGGGLMPMAISDGRELTRDNDHNEVFVMKDSYSLEELDPEWRGVLNDLDRRLQARDHTSMTGHERATAIKYLLATTRTQGADYAKESVLDIILQERQLHRR